MLNEIKESVWGQFAASMDMFKNALDACPEETWEADRKFFLISFHCLFFLDYFLTNPPKDFKSTFKYSIAEPGKIPEGQLDDIIPGEPYDKADLLAHLAASRQKCRNLIDGLTEDGLASRWIEEGEGGLNYNLVEMLIYNMRHVQHHAAQLNMMLRNHINSAPGWIGRIEW
ncbi:MAG: DinB family protein [Chitinophagaceae bacterium]|nr:MAG: DinB family protein [Chitinophagaceae bacterium]